MSHPLSRIVDEVLDRTVAPGYSRVGLAVRRHLNSWPADPAPDALVDHSILVTGASGGLGEATALGLARLGADLHLMGRKADGLRAAARRIEAHVPGATVEIHPCDIADLDAVRRWAAEFNATGTSLATIVHNAGVMPPERTESQQAHELSMAVHVLGPVLLTELLRDRLAGGRAIFVTSGGMYAQSLPADDPGYEQGRYSPAAAYARSKRMQVELLPLLADRWSSDAIMTAATHPGWADTPGVRESMPTFRRFTRPILRDEAEGADTTVWLAATEPTPQTGLLWHDRQPRPTHLIPRTRSTAADQQWAWQWLCTTVGLS